MSHNSLLLPSVIPVLWWGPLVSISISIWIDPGNLWGDAHAFPVLLEGIYPVFLVSTMGVTGHQGLDPQLSSPLTLLYHV